MLGRTNGEEERVDRDADRGAAVRIEQQPARKISVALEGDAVGKVERVGGVVRREHAVEALSHGAKLDVVADVRLQKQLRLVGGDCRERVRTPRAESIARSEESGHPALRGPGPLKLLEQKSGIAAIGDRKRRIRGVGNREQVARPTAAAVQGAPYVEEIVIRVGTVGPR